MLKDIGDQAERRLSFFTIRRYGDGFKKPLTFDEQVDKLVSYGIIVEDRNIYHKPWRTSCSVIYFTSIYIEVILKLY